MTVTNLLSSKRFDRAIFSLFFAAIIPVALAHGQQSPAAMPASSAAGTEIRTYDVSDLIHAGRDHPYSSTIVRPTQLMAAESTVAVHSGGGGGQGNQGLFGGNSGHDEQEQRTPDEITQEIITFIQESVEPDSWRANGGVVGNITYQRGRLIVRHTPHVHDQVLALLEELRPITVTVRAKWVRLSDTQLATLAQGGEAGPSRAIGSKPFTSLIAAEPSIVLHEGETTCFSGQTVHLAAGHAKMCSIDSESIVGNNAVGYNPVTRMVHIGAILQVNPIVNPETKSAIMELWSEVSEDHTKPDAPGIPAAGLKGESGPVSVQMGAIDRLDLAIHHFGTTLKVPLNTPVIVAGMSMPGAEGGEGKPAAPLYLVLEVIAGD